MDSGLPRKSDNDCTVSNVEEAQKPVNIGGPSKFQSLKQHEYTLIASIVLGKADLVKIGLGTARLDDDQQLLYQWLNPLDPSTDHSRATRLRHENTGTWFLEEGYIHWKDTPQSFLCLTGKPACGKTILASTIIEAIAQDPKPSSLLYFYFTFSDSRKQQLDHMMRTLIWQLYCQQPQAREPLDSLFKDIKSRRSVCSVDSLNSVLQKMLQLSNELCIVLDALDESKLPKTISQCDLFSWLRQIRDVKCKHHILVTSRSEQDIEANPDYIISLHNNNFVQEDIAQYIRSRVHASFERWVGCPDIQQKIETALAKEANGM